MDIPATRSSWNHWSSSIRQDNTAGKTLNRTIDLVPEASAAPVYIDDEAVVDAPDQYLQNHQLGTDCGMFADTGRRIGMVALYQ